MTTLHTKAAADLAAIREEAAEIDRQARDHNTRRAALMSRHQAALDQAQALRADAVRAADDLADAIEGDAMGTAALEALTQARSKATKAATAAAGAVALDAEADALQRAISRLDSEGTRFGAALAELQARERGLALAHLHELAADVSRRQREAMAALGRVLADGAALAHAADAAGGMGGHFGPTEPAALRLADAGDRAANAVQFDPLSALPEAQRDLLAGLRRIGFRFA